MDVVQLTLSLRSLNKNTLHTLHHRLCHILSLYFNTFSIMIIQAVMYTMNSSVVKVDFGLMFSING
jgi:hypothetical protein